MPILADYHQFGGRHWESGSLHNYFAYRKVRAPHTAAPYSEALLMGIAGGLVTGYFSFAYEGVDPHVALLTRNTFDPLDTVLTRLGIVQEVRQTNKAEKGLANLLDVLDEGLPAIVWADMWSLPYNTFVAHDGMWGMMPIIVYGYEDTTDTVLVADRAAVGLTISTAALATARARVKQERFRLLTLDQPDPEKLPAAVTAGIWDCINLYLEKPPKGSPNNWGIRAFTYWAELLSNPKQRLSWARVFPAGPAMYAGLTSAFSHYGVTGIRHDAERGLYADFLDEAALILRKPALQEVAAAFRQSSIAWQTLATILLPDAVAPFGESRRLIVQKAERFRTAGAGAQAEIEQMNERLRAIRAAMATDFPLADHAVVDHRTAIADGLLQIAAIEEAAVIKLRAIMAT
jgi:hypothetical protein